MNTLLFVLVIVFLFVVNIPFIGDSGNWTLCVLFTAVEGIIFGILWGIYSAREQLEEVLNNDENNG